MATVLALVSRLAPDQQAAIAADHPALELRDLSERRDELVDQGDAVEVVYGMVRPHELAALTGLRWVQASWAGVENLLYPAMIEREIVITNVRGQRATAMAEHAVAGLLHMLRDFPAHAAAQRAGEWRSEAQARLLCDSHVAVLGTGGIGRAVITRLQALGARVTGVSRSGAPVAGCDRVVAASGLATELPDIDHVVVTVPATADTTGLVDGAFLDALRSGAIVVNVSRGAVVVEADLLDRLDRGRVAGAVLDVTHPEPPPPGSPLYAHPRILLTGHRSGQPRQDPGTGGGDVLRHNLACWLRGDRDAMRNVVDPTAGY